MHISARCLQDDPAAAEASLQQPLALPVQPPQAPPLAPEDQAAADQKLAEQRSVLHDLEARSMGCCEGVGRVCFRCIRHLCAMVFKGDIWGLQAA